MPRFTLPSFVVIALSFLIAAAPACSETPSVPEPSNGLPLSGRVSRIINGTPATEQRFDAVVQLRYMGSGICSGTLITDTVVLTAAHCVYVKGCEYNYATGQSRNCQLETNADRFRIEVHPSDMGGGISTTRQSRTVTDVHPHPDYEGHLTEVYGSDIALLRIKQPFDNVTPIPALPNEPGFAWAQADVGSEVTFVGYGVTETGSSGQRLYVTDPIDIVCLTGDDSCPREATPGTVCSYFGNGLTCSGDSGGPLLIERDGVLYNGGVTSYGDANCRSFGCSTAVSSFADWIADYLGGDGLPGGAGCVNNGQCQSGICTLGVCCDKVCVDAPCEACSTARGAAMAGVCAWTTSICEDGDLCTSGDRCGQGICRTGLATTTCPAENQCNFASVCEPSTGQCQPRDQKPIDTPCDDGNACTLNDHCHLGACVNTGTIHCPSPGECQTLRGNSGCHTVTGACMYEDVADGISCGEAGDAATCQSGKCVKPKSNSGGGCGVVTDGRGKVDPNAGWLATLAVLAMGLCRHSIRRWG
jgi:hypothetical protein